MALRRTAAALTVVAALGVSGPAVAASAHAAPATEPGNHGHNDGGHGGGHGHRGDLAKAQRKAHHDIAGVSARLTQVTKRIQRAKISAESKAAVAANVAADQAALDTLAAQVDAAVTVADLKPVFVALKAERVENYNVTLALLRFSERIEADLDEARASAADDPDTLAMLDEIEAVVRDVVDALLDITADAPPEDLRGSENTLRLAQATLEALLDALSHG